MLRLFCLVVVVLNPGRKKVTTRGERPIDTFSVERTENGTTEIFVLDRHKMKNDDITPFKKLTGITGLKCLI